MKKGDQGPDVKTIQYKLKKTLNQSLSLDGDFGPSTEIAVKKFQHIYGLTVDGVVGQQTRRKIVDVYRLMFKDNSDLLHFGKRRFVVFVDAGHGGVDDTGIYVTPGKRAYHKPDNVTFSKMHERGHYYEGFENRLAAEAFIEACTDVGIMCVRTYHPHKDTSLSYRSGIIQSYLRRGYYGYLHSFHSNAISSTNSVAKLNATRGFCVYSTRENNFSDKIADHHFIHVKETTGHGWVYRSQTKPDGDADFEANFQILKETDLEEFHWFGAILDEWGFHTSREDCKFIVNPFNRKLRTEACLKTAKWVKKELELLIKTPS